MKFLLIGGGSGGHITPLLAVAHELKKLHPEAQISAVCEKGSRFKYLYDESEDIGAVHQIPAGKYRRYAGYSMLQKAADIKTLALNGRDVFRTVRGYRQAIKLLKKEKPDALLIKGGFVAVPVGLAAARLNIPFVTHDSDSTPGLANRIISRWASKHATGMPAELYSYPRENTVFTGIPVSSKFKKVNDDLRAEYRNQAGLGHCKRVITVVGGSQGGEQLNNDIVKISAKLMQEFSGLGILHIAGEHKMAMTEKAYSKVLDPVTSKNVIVKGFVSNVEVFQGAADVVITRAGATQTAELSLQALPIVIVPGKLAGAHQEKNARLYAEKGAALVAPYGDSQSLYAAISQLLGSKRDRDNLSSNLYKLAKPHAAKELAEVTLRTAGKS